MTITDNEVTKMDMYIQKYISFVKTVEYGSFTKAAEIMNYSQSGISRMIADLEHDWKVTLLERGNGNVKLTSDGLKLLPFAQNLVSDFEKLQMEVDDLHGVQSGIIRIGTFSSVATHWIPNIIAEFQKKYPNLEYELLLGHYAEIERWIAEGRVDFGFLRLPTRSNFETEFLEKDKLFVVLPKNHPLADCDRFPVKALEKDPFILLEKDEKAEISEIFEQNHIKPDVRFTTVDDYAVMSMVEKGLGISILPELILKRIPFNIVSKELDVPAYRNIGIAVKNRKTASLAVKRFLEYLPYRYD